ncbi:uncharacterized protein [Paramormyrops kingsleyae]|uniref:uncharacterized protein isoform X1 n=2 Tax=Paramormyrops kingsleyae TaxID=1676925 RepID=UPI003B96A1D9
MYVINMDHHKCEVCDKNFTEKSNLTRHMKIHTPKEHDCGVCGKSFSTKPNLHLHLKQHQYPRIHLYRQGEAWLQCTAAAKAVAEAPNKVEDPTWLDAAKAEAFAKKAGGEMWKGQLVHTFGKYAGQSFRWLLENDVGWVVWLLGEYCQKGEQNDHLKWQKERMLEYVRDFPSVRCHLDKKLKKQASKSESSVSQFQHDANYASDAELLAAAENLLDESSAARSSCSAVVTATTRETSSAVRAASPCRWEKAW